MRATISRAEVHAICRMLGADPDNVRALTATPFEVTVSTRSSDTVIPVVGDRDGDTVTMRHPNLPGRVIDVRPRGVGQRAMAGWEVVPPYDNGGELPSGVGEVTSAEPMPVTPPPDSGSKPEAPAPSGASSSPPPRGRRTKKKEEDG